MYLRRRVRIQLAAFAAIALIAMSVLAFGYAHAGALLFGIGRYTVTVELPVSGGLYQRANVTYRGTQVGRISDVELTDSGVRATLSLTSGLDVPSDLTAEVRSQSVIGEQYIALVPRNTASRPLREGDVIPPERTSAPPDVGDLLDRTNTALTAIPRDNLKTVVDESYTALAGLGPALSRIVDGGTDLAAGAKDSVGELVNLIDNSAPILKSQTTTADSVTAWAAHLATITGQLSRHDAAVSGLLTNAGPATSQAQTLLDRVNPTLPIVLSNLVSVDDVALVYHPNVEQLLVLLPQAVRMIFGIAGANIDQKLGVKGSFQSFATNLNLPPPCVTGYLPPSQRRSPVLTDAPPRLPGDVYCRIPQDSENNVRGARNFPCEGKPGKRAPTVWMCESDENYVPLNDGTAWKGDPNATLSDQNLPQLPGTPTAGPGHSAPPPPVGFADYNPTTGTYIGPDGQVYTQRNLAGSATAPTLRSMLVPPPG